LAAGRALEDFLPASMASSLGFFRCTVKHFAFATDILRFRKELENTVPADKNTRSVHNRLIQLLFVATNISAATS
jgi:hypothetical protein